MIDLRPHQIKAVNDVELSLLTNENVLLVLPTGAGKTYIKAEFARKFKLLNQIIIIFAHRDILISQISKSLCEMGVQHTFIASQKTVTEITNFNLKEFGDSFYKETSTVILASVATFSRRVDSGVLFQLLPMVKLWTLDEAHHLTVGSMWYKCTNSLINSKGIGVTATAIRGDKKGLGRCSDGVFDSLIKGTDMGVLIKQGYLSPYRIFVPPTKLDTTGINITASGDLNQKQLAERTDTHDITGDAVDHYLKLANGLRTITFAVNIAHAKHVANEFNLRGIPSIALSSDSSTKELREGLVEFEAGRILNLVNCDLFGEGYDCPAVECVIMLRKTYSYGLFKQQFGRCLRIYGGKLYGILIDHVGNVPRHCIYGEPHNDPEWTLERSGEKQEKQEKQENRLCPKCWSYYTPTIKTKYVCRYCYHEESVDEINQAQIKYQSNEGTLVEMNVDFINSLIDERNKVDIPVDDFKENMKYSKCLVRNSAVNNHIKRQNAQLILRNKIQSWCENLANKNKSWNQLVVQREFERMYGVNILKAQVLSERLTLELNERIEL